MPGYILCASPRSGSTLLCDMLWQTRVAGKPNSFFRPQSVGNFCRRWGLPETTLATIDQTYLDAAIAEGVQGTGTFGLRIMHDNIAGLLARLKALNGHKDDVAALIHVFGPLRFIHLSRDDKMAQAVSLAIAEQTGLWHKNADGTDRENFHLSPDPIYDRVQIARELAGLEDEARGWATWFATNDIAPLRLTYETLSADPPGTLAKVLAHIGQDPARAQTATPGTKRLADTINQDWAIRFRAETGLPSPPHPA